MFLDAWLPKNHQISDDVILTNVIYAGVNWQIYEIVLGGKVLLASDELANQWVDRGLINEIPGNHFKFGSERYFFISSNDKLQLVPVSDCPAPVNKKSALKFAAAIAATRRIESDATLSDSIYLESINRLLPTYCETAFLPDDVVLGRYLTGGVPISTNANKRILKLIEWADTAALDEIRAQADFSFAKKADIDGLKDEGKKNEFVLAGRADLERFLHEHVIDIIENRERYSAFGIEFPSAIILHGPPGCGKTYAIERLVEYLGWPCYQVEASSIASPYIHETSKKIATIFDKAIENSPSVVVIDEMEAFLADRQSGIGHHHVEEVAEFLRRIPEAIKSNVLVVGMTNRIGMIDPAILRRGRFDHVVEVDMASELEVTALLENLLEKMPRQQGIDISMLAKQLVGRPLSDVTFIVREGARLAARASKEKIDQICLLQALKASPVRTPSKR